METVYNRVLKGIVQNSGTCDGRHLKIGAGVAVFSG